MFEWNESFSVDIPLIDQQHKKLFDIGERVYRLIEEDYNNKNFHEIMNLIDELYKYTKYHFEEEEKIMKFYNFPELSIHRHEHNKFIEYLDDIRIGEIAKEEDSALNDLISFIASWIVRHIGSVDVKYKEYIMKKNNRFFDFKS
jgi:hemerythrin